MGTLFMLNLYGPPSVLIHFPSLPPRTIVLFSIGPREKVECGFPAIVFAVYKGTL